MKKLITLMVVFCNYTTFAQQMTYVPDDDFEEGLEYLGFGNGIAGDDSVLTSAVSAIDSISLNPNVWCFACGSISITDLTGLQDFTSLRVLDLFGNGDLGLNGSIESKIPSLPNLEWLNVEACAYDTLDISNLPSLKYVSARRIGVVQALGGISSRLKFLNISNSQNIETINLGKNSGVNISNLLNLNSLKTLILDDVSSTSGVLDLSNLNSLEYLDIYNDNVNNLVLNNNLNLEYLNCSNNSLTSLELYNNSEIEYLDCSGNTLVYLDLVNQTNIEHLDCNTSNVICLNLKNGNNLNMSFINATGNPTLSCIDVDDSLVSTAIWIPGSNYNFDNYSFSNNCGLPCSGSISNLPTISLDKFSIYPNPTQEKITISIDGFNGDIKTNIYDLIGNKLQTSNETTISLRDYSNGIYLLKVVYGDRIEEVKVIKE